MQSIQDIQAQLAQQSQLQAKADAAKKAQLNARPASWNHATSFDPSGAWGQGVANQQLDSQAAMNQSAISGQDPSMSPGAAMNRIIGIGDQAYQQAQNNPVDQMLMQELSKRVSGQTNPYDATTINAMKTGAAEQSAGAEMANNQQAMQSLESRGFTPNDPSYQAALSQNQTQRQQSNQAANLSIAQNANLANYNAQGQAIGQANAVNRGAQQQQLAAGQFATQGLNQVNQTDMAKQPAWQQLPTWQQYNKPKTAAAPKPATQSF